MSRLRSIIRELLGLFVDDGDFAAVIIAWLVSAWLIVQHLSIPPAWLGPILFIGLAAILVESVQRRSRRP
jgi:hypothetical protein